MSCICCGLWLYLCCVWAWIPWACCINIFLRSWVYIMLREFWIYIGADIVPELSRFEPPRVDSYNPYRTQPRQLRCTNRWDRESFISAATCDGSETALRKNTRIGGIVGGPASLARKPISNFGGEARKNQSWIWGLEEPSSTSQERSQIMIILTIKTLVRFLLLENLVFTCISTLPVQSNVWGCESFW